MASTRENIDSAIRFGRDFLGASLAATTASVALIFLEIHAVETVCAIVNCLLYRGA